MFKALLLTKTESGAPHCVVTELDEAQLPAGEVLVQVSHSTLNYKDGLAITGQAPWCAPGRWCRASTLRARCWNRATRATAWATAWC